MASPKKDPPAVANPQDWPEVDDSLSPIHEFSTIKPNPDPNPFDQQPPPGPSVIQELGKAKETK
jgi:hypothetical protein